MAISRIEKCNGLSDFGSYGKNVDISFHKLHLKSKFNTSTGNTIVLNTTSLPNKYWDYIMSTCTEYTFSESNFIKYKYQPKLFCYDYYGNLELWGFLLKVNYMTSILDFDKKTIRVFNSKIIKLLEEILIIEDEDIRKNTQEIEQV